MWTEFKAYNLVWNWWSSLQKGTVARQLENIPVLVMDKNAFTFKKFMEVWEPGIQGTQKTYFISCTWSAPKLTIDPKLNGKIFKIPLGKKLLPNKISTNPQLGGICCIRQGARQRNFPGINRAITRTEKEMYLLPWFLKHAPQ